VCVARLEDVFRRDRLASQLSTHGAANERVLVEDTDLAHVARVVTDDDVLADVGGKRQIEIAKTLKVDTVALDAPRTHDRQQREVQLLELLRQARQKPVGFPTNLRFHSSFAVRIPVVFVQQPGAKACVKLTER